MDVWGEQDQHYPNHWSLYEIAYARDSCEGKQRVSPFYHGSELCFQGLKQSDPTNQEREHHPFAVLHPRRWFLILLNCVKLKFVSYTSNLLEQLYDFQRCNVPPEVDFESSRSPAKSESWNSPNLHCLAVFPTWQYCLYSHVWCMWEIKRDNRLSQALVHFVIDRASLFTDRRISGLPIRAKYKHFRTIWEHNLKKFSQGFHFFFEMMVINEWSWYFVELVSRPVCQLTISFHTFLGTTFHIVGPRRNTKILGVWKFFSCSRGNSGFKHGSVNGQQYLCLFHIVFECTPGTHDQGKMLVLPNQLLYWVLSTSD